MKNTAMLLNLIDRYNDLAYTHNYIFGFTFSGNVYMARATKKILPAILCVDRASGGQGASLRFCPTKDIKLALMAHAEVLCTKSYFDAVCAESKYNKGEVFEMLVTESYGQHWEKDNVPFTEAGDIEVGGISYQIKYQKASFSNEKSLARLERA